MTKTQVLTAAALLASCGGDTKPAAKDATVIVPDATDPCTLAKTSAELMACVDEQRLESDISIVAMERVPGSSQWQAVQDLCKTRLEASGFTVELVNYASGTNVIGRKEGTDPAAGDVIVSAHYDHIPGCPGASDNAAGVAMTLEVARLLGSRDSRHPLVVACWDEEELGLIGSRAYAASAKSAGTNISAMFSFDAMGYFSSEPNTQTFPAGFDSLFPQQSAVVVANQSRGDFVALIADESAADSTASFAKHAESVGLTVSVLTLPESLKLSPLTADLRRSDHASFWENEYPGVQLTDTANFRNPNYHCRNGMDLPSTLDMDFVKQTTQATVGALLDDLDKP